MNGLVRQIDLRVGQTSLSKHPLTISLSDGMLVVHVIILAQTKPETVE